MKSFLYAFIISLSVIVVLSCQKEVFIETNNGNEKTDYVDTRNNLWLPIFNMPRIDIKTQAVVSLIGGTIKSNTRRLINLGYSGTLNLYFGPSMAYIDSKMN